MSKKERAKLFSQDYQKDWSEKHKYKHIHTGEYCTFEAYVAEYLILRWTETFKMDRPSYKFWTVGDKYHEPFMRNMKAVQSLKKKFEEKTILLAIQSQHFDKIYHIGLKAYGPRGWKYNRVALEAIQRYNEEARSREEAAKIAQNNDFVEPEKINQTRRTSTIKTKTSMINKLRNL